MTRRRFTDADKWDDAWYYGLTPAAKLVFGYLCDRCDLVGVWKVNCRQAANAIGMELDWDALLLEFGERVEDLGGDRWLLTRFFRFQYPRGIGSRSVPHRAIRNALRSHGLLDRFAASLHDETPEGTPTLAEPFTNGSASHKDKDSSSRDLRNRGGEKPPEVSGDTRARPAPVASDPGDLTTPRQGDPPIARLRIVADTSPEVDAIDHLRFAGARVQRDDRGTWLIAAREHGLPKVLEVVRAIVAAGEAPWWSTVAAWLKGNHSAKAPADDWHYPSWVKWDDDGPHSMIDGKRVPFRPTRKRTDVQQGAR